MAIIDPRVERYKNVTDLRQYDRKYRVVNDGTNGDEGVERIWEMCIPGKNGQIYPHGFNGSLAVCVTSQSAYKLVCAVLGQEPLEMLRGEERVVKFPHEPALLHKIATAIKARKSRKGRVLTPEQRAASAARLKAWHASQKPVPSPDSKAS